MPAFSLNRADHRFARVHPDASLKRQFALHPQPIRVALEILLHPQRRIQRALRMILVGDRRAEQGEDAVAGGLQAESRSQV